MTFIAHPSPNHDARGSVAVDMLVLHYTGMKTGAEALGRLSDPAAKVSAHYLVEEDGRVFELVDESQRAWHAGVASWRGHRDINARSIGIEIVNPGHEWGYRPFPEAQMHSVLALCHDILTRHAIAPRNVVGHSDVAPARKADPGELFPWQWLAEQGVGLFPSLDKSPAKSQRKLPAQSSASEASGDLADKKGKTGFLNGLAHYGYGAGSATPEQLITAFQRHFRPETVNGQWDDECAARLEAILGGVNKN